MPNRWIELMPPDLRSQLKEIDLKSLDFLESVVSDRESVEDIEGGCLLVRNGQAEITLNVLETFARRRDNDPHLAITVGVRGFPEYHREIWIFNSNRHGSTVDIPVGDICASFVLLADTGFPEQCVPQHLLVEIERANRFADGDEDGT